MYEYQTHIYSGSHAAFDNYLDPTNGALDCWLTEKAHDGWELVSYDWTSFRRAILRRAVG